MNNERLARRIVKERSGGDCEVLIPGVHIGGNPNYQHRKNKGQGGKYSGSNGLAACGSGTTGCHGYIHAHPAESYANGWSVRSTLDPAEVPVLIRQSFWALLDDEGNYHAVIGDAA